MVFQVPRLVAILGIVTQSGATTNIFNNKIDSIFPGQSATAGAAGTGIRVATLAAGNTVNIYNNFISMDLSQAVTPASNNVLTGTDAFKGLERIPAGGNVNLYYNTVRLAGGGAAAGNFGSSGIGLSVVQV